MSPQQVESLRRGVRAMKDLPATDPRNWFFQANMHWTDGPKSNALFNQCQHGTLHFLTWHRAYLHFFERILRSLSGDPALTLPYWDWASAPTLPEPYLLPAEPSNPLWDDTRVMNDGSAVLPEDVSGIAGALAAVAYPGSDGFNSLLEDNPHGTIHGAVGGNMSRVPTAARDPIFWLHHANVDRLWNVWLNQGGRANPSDSPFLNATFPFADETGATVRVAVKDFITSAGLGYRYDSVPNPAPVPTTVVTAAVPVAAPAPPVVTAASEPAEKGRGKALGFAVERVRVKPVKPAGAVPVAAVSGGKVLVRVDGISADKSPAGLRFGVYLNAPEGALAGPERLQYHVGTINFFGRTRPEAKLHAHGHDHDHAEDGTFSETFDATAVVERLRQANRWNPDEIDVVIMPVASTPPAGAAGVARKAVGAAAAAGVRYKGVTLLSQ